MDAAAQQSAASGTSLLRTLVSMGAVSEAQVVATVAAQLGLPFADTAPGAVDPAAAALLPSDEARELGALPVAFGQDNDVIVALADPGNEAALARVSALSGLTALPALAVRADLQAAIEVVAGDGSAPAANGSAPAAAGAAPAAPDPGLLAFEQATTIDLDAVLAALLKLGGSDLHLTTGVPPMIRVNGELEPLEG